MTHKDLVVTEIDGKIIEGTLRPSSNRPTNLILYRAFPGMGVVAHTLSRHATAWAQAQKEIPCLGTTHADYFHGYVQLTKPLTPKEIRSGYEVNTGYLIIHRFRNQQPPNSPAVLVANHGPCCSGRPPANTA